jgi:phospholipase C
MLTFLVIAVVWAVRPARATDDEGLALMMQDEEVAEAFDRIGKMPLSTNVLGYDPCDDPAADRSRLSGCVANAKVEHVLYVVQENHSFDNYFGNLNRDAARVPGADVSGVHNAVPQRLKPGLAEKDYRFPVRPFHLDEYCGWSDVAHVWPAIHNEVNGGKLDGYVAASSTNSPAMGQFDSGDLDYYYALAQTFAVSDRHFASAATQSSPNHFYTMSGTSGGWMNNDGAPRRSPSVDPETGRSDPGATGLEWRSIFDSVEDGGISWKIYMSSIANPMAFSNFKKWVATGHVVPVEQYYRDLVQGTLPQVAYLATQPAVGDEHPGTGNQQKGELQVATMVYALLASSAWPTSVLFVTYDDSGGWYDHVPPPRAYQPRDFCTGHALATAQNCVNDTWVPGSKAGTAAPLPADGRFGDHYDLLGARLPFTIVSPWVKRGPNGLGYAVHRSSENATILSFIEWRFGLPSLNDRTRAYKDGWRNPGCDWDVQKLRTAAAAKNAPAEIRGLAWSAALADPFRTVRCEPCPASDPYCASPAPSRDADRRAKVYDSHGQLMPLTLAVRENRYLDPLLAPFDFTRAESTLLDGVAIAAALPPLANVDVEEAGRCPAAQTRLTQLP